MDTLALILSIIGSPFKFLAPEISIQELSYGGGGEVRTHAYAVLETAAFPLGYSALS